MNKTRSRKNARARTKVVGAWTLALGAALSAAPAVAQQEATASAGMSGAADTVLAGRVAAADEGALPVSDFYQRFQLTLAWQSAEQVKALARALESLAEDGLTPDDYWPGPETPLAAFERSRGAGSEARADFDLKATRALLQALDDLQRGRVDPKAQVSGWSTPRPARAYSMTRVTTAVSEADVARALSHARPDTPAYRQLRAALAEYRELERLARRSTAPLVPTTDEALRPGDEHPDVVTLRRRLAYWGMADVLFGDPAAYARVDARAPNLERFDAALEDAVKRFQRRHLLNEDGVVGGKTRRALNRGLAGHVEALRLNLERARWMQPIMALKPGVWVDIAGYRMHYTRPDGERWSSKVIVGRAGRETPVLHSAITHFTVNPTWTVPPTIWREDALPQIRRDQSYLARRNMQVLSPDGTRLDPAEVNWQAPGNVMLRQAAGPGNPLGRVVVRFPNNQLIYLHDTPSRGLFNRDRRALSSGCVRVEGVRELVRMLLEDTGSRYRLSTLLQRGKSDLNVSLPRRVPVALVYLTAWPDAFGEVTFRPDIYRRDEALLRQL